MCIRDRYTANADQRDLNNLRYLSFLKSSTKVKADLPSLPPTRGSAEQHSLRVYLQVQQWLGNNLPPDQWGWTQGEDEYLITVKTMEPVAPETILNTIFCRCTTGCGGRCGCRKAGIKCTSVCGTAMAHAPTVHLRKKKNGTTERMKSTQKKMLFRYIHIYILIHVFLTSKRMLTVPIECSIQKFKT